MLPSISRPLRVAIIGAGPAGFYTAEVLFQSGVSLEVHMFEKLPAPFGLVRYGVAPDHQKIKNVIKVFEKTASDKRFFYFGNVTIGRDLSVQELKKFYDAAIFCYGAEADRQLGIKGEGLKGCYKASQFIGWYNGHPQFADEEFDFSHETAVVMGQGNVAIDIARILCSTKEELAKTDICQHALDMLAESKVKEVHIYGRRSVAHVAFTPVEIREMGNLQDCCPVVDPADLVLAPDSIKDLEELANAFRKKDIEILRSFTAMSQGGRKRKFFLHFNRSPVEIIGVSRVQKARFEINEQGKPSGKYEEIECGSFFTCIGYVGEPIEGLPFLPQKGIVPNLKGRILEGEVPVKGSYVCGWIAQGASGVIGTNKLRAQETIHSLMEDLALLPGCETPDTKEMLDLFKSRGVFAVTFIDWKKIDAYEVMMGSNLGKPREKLIRVGQMISVADGSYKQKGTLSS